MVFSGTMDWLTTVIGIFFFGAVESNPFMAGFANNSLFAFTVVKLAFTFIVAFLFQRADKTIQEENNKNSRSYMLSRVSLKAAYILSTSVLFAAVLNNMVVVAHAL